MVMAAAVEGRVVQIIGTVIDIEFPPDHLPAINHAVNITRDNGAQLVTEVQQHLGNNWVRCLAMDTTDGLVRGAPAKDMGQAIAVPVGELALGRMFNVLGDPIDNLPPPTDAPRWGITARPRRSTSRRPPPPSSRPASR